MSKKLTLADKLSGNIDYASGKLKGMIDSYGCFEERRALENGYDWKNADDYEISDELVSVDYD